jgi:hypothetical protein
MFDANELEREIFQGSPTTTTTTTTPTITLKSTAQHFDLQSALSILNSSYQSVIANKNFEVFSAETSNGRPTVVSNVEHQNNKVKQYHGSRSSKSAAAAAAATITTTTTSSTSRPVNAWKK